MGCALRLLRRLCKLATERRSSKSSSVDLKARTTRNCLGRKRQIHKIRTKSSTVCWYFLGGSFVIKKYYRFKNIIKWDHIIEFRLLEGKQTENSRLVESSSCHGSLLCWCDISRGNFSVIGDQIPIDTQGRHIKDCQFIQRILCCVKSTGTIFVRIINMGTELGSNQILISFSIS